MSYRQITCEERYMLSVLRLQGYSCAEIARHLGRHRSTILREVRRNRCNDGDYRPSKADSRTCRRRQESRRKWYTPAVHLQLAMKLLCLDWSPEQIAAWLRRYRVFRISHQTLYRYIWYDQFNGGYLYTHLRQAGKRRRKRYGRRDSRGVLSGKRHISQRPTGAANRSRLGHWEVDTVMGGNDLHCIVTMVERKSRYTLIGKLKARTTAQLNRRIIKMIQAEARKVRTITADNGTEFHDYETVEAATGTCFYFATPHHSWERGLNENTNGLIRQYLPKGRSMANLTQRKCNVIAMKLNKRPRKTLNYQTPEQCYATE